MQVEKIARTTTEPEVKADADKLLKEIAQYKMDVWELNPHPPIF